jgi:hypothetical protein
MDLEINNKIYSFFINMTYIGKLLMILSSIIESNASRVQTVGFKEDVNKCW